MNRFLKGILSALIIAVSTTNVAEAQLLDNSTLHSTSAVESATFDISLPIYVGQDILVENQFSNREKLVREVGRYLENINAPRDITADHIVNCCLQNDFDITFLLAQGTLETGMGKAGAGRTRNSVFGVVKRRFPTRNDAVTHYVDLVLTKYYRGSWDALMHNYVSRAGYRYAARGYEANLRKSYNSVSKNYPLIGTLQKAAKQEMTLYAELVPIEFSEVK